MNRLVAALFFLVLAFPVAAEQDYPSRTLRIVVPFAPGGSTDIFARYIADKLAPALAQPVVVENRAGAGGNIGAEAVARSAPDGYTLLMATTGVMSINNALYANMTYDAAKDFEPVIFVASITNVLVVAPDLPATSVRELIALAKAKPGALSFGSSGAGSSTHLSSELFKSMAGIDILHIPYKGSSQALTDLMAGRISMIIDNMPGAIGFIKEGRVRALGVTGSKRSPALPGLPTIAEAGVAGYESLSWSGIAVPAGTPKDVVARLNREIAAILAQPDIREKFAQAGAEPVGGPPQQFADHIRSEREKWSKLIRERGITIN
ncbi:MAG TPA: tripartite tricarboxylate transporter substrate binding protein [Casimicrobiaceae bacterium]|nr:tripartite tricarboxylate transporter substrate binding protein [Casimicrobiaceae bacterium]